MQISRLEEKFLPQKTKLDKCLFEIMWSTFIFNYKIYIYEKI